MAGDHAANLFSEPRKLSTEVRCVERTSSELGIKLIVTKDTDIFNKAYTLHTQFGKGGFGRVLRAKHNGSGESVVIKQVDSDRVPCWCRLDGEKIPMEVVLLAKLSHVYGVVSVREVYNLHGTWNIVMAGNAPPVQDLFDYICKRGCLGECESAFIAYQLVGILMKCHEAGVIHRDLKDENILINANNHEIQIIDFGSGAFLHDGVYSDFDGTRVYSPPEWIKTNGYHGKSAEIWTFGILLFDMINGDIPFMSDSEIISGSVQFRRSQVSHEAMDLICSCCRLDPRDRPTLMQILLHPWMRIYRNTVSQLQCQSSQYALDVSAKHMPSPLATSITVRSGLCDLAKLCIEQGNISSNQSILRKKLQKEQAEEESKQKQESESKEAEYAEGGDEKGTIQTQENCKISNFLLPIQSLKSSSSSHNGHVYSGYLRKRRPSPPSNAVNGDSSSSTFRRNSVNINPLASGCLHRYDTRHPQPDGHPFFRQVQQLQFSWDIERDFDLQEEPARPNSSESHNSSGYFTRSNSMEGEVNQTAAFAQTTQQFIRPAFVFASPDSTASLLSAYTAADKGDFFAKPNELEVLSTDSYLKRNLKVTPLTAHEIIRNGGRRRRRGRSNCEAVVSMSSSNSSDEEQDVPVQSRGLKPRKL